MFDKQQQNENVTGYNSYFKLKKEAYRTWLPRSKRFGCTSRFTSWGETGQHTGLSPNNIHSTCRQGGVNQNLCPGSVPFSLPWIPVSSCFPSHREEDATPTWDTVQCWVEAQPEQGAAVGGWACSWLGNPSLSMRERTQKQGSVSRHTALHLDKPPLCWSFLFKGRARLHHSQPRRRNSGKTVYRPPPPSSEVLVGGGRLMTTSRAGRMRPSCFDSASKLQSSGGKPHPGRRLRRKGCFVV